MGYQVLYRTRLEQVVKTLEKQEETPGTCQRFRVSPHS